MLTEINFLFWTAVLLPLTLIASVYLTVKCRFFQFLKFKKIIKTAFSRGENTKGTSPFGAMCIALSGTMGIGNIAGVGTAIALGGVGAIFWMVVGAFLCMILKFSEVVLAMKYRDGTRGGLMYVIRERLPKLYPLGVAFAILTVVSSVGTGGITQSGASATAMKSVFGTPKILTGIVFGAVVLLMLTVGASKLSKIAGTVVPILSAVFILGCIFVIIRNCSQIPRALGDIFSSAFNMKSASGGTAGFLLSNSLRYGISRGIFTNEAGMGTAPIVHASAQSTPLKQGCLGIFEVFFDTVVMCPITALAIITTRSHLLCGVSPVNFTLSAFSSVFGRSGEMFVALSTLFFGVLAGVGWSFYGKCCCKFLFKTNKSVMIYSMLFCIFTAIGACIPELQIFELADILNGLMMLPNLLVILILAEEVVFQSRFFQSRNLHCSKF